MKNIASKIVCTALAAAILFSTAVALFAKDEACYRGEKDADAAEAGFQFLFFGAGCLLGPIGILLGYTVMPPIPENKLMGKSSVYVAGYVSCYNDRARGRQGPASALGCSALMLAGFAYWMVFFVFKPFSSAL